MHLTFRARSRLLLLVPIALTLECACVYLDESRKPGEDMTTSEVDGNAAQLPVQAKLTFLGPQSKPVPTLVIFTGGHPPSLEIFAAFHRSHRAYDNDDLPYTVMTAASHDEIMRLLRAGKALIETSSAADAEFLSFTVVVETLNGKTGQEFVVRESLLENFYRMAIAAMNPENSSARQALSSQATKMGLKL